MKANEIVDVLTQFKDSSYKKILIDGNWGIGKTKYILEFKEENEDICYISLFGKRDIESILQEIYIQITENEAYKKHVRNFAEKFNGMKVKYRGLPISIPFIKDIQAVVQKELGKKNIIIILDDLERKHDDLDIKEIFGFMDSISNIDVKTILVAAKNKIEGRDNDIFSNYREKAIDRIYKIENYADEAPNEILGDEKWRTISKVAQNFNFKNLRTFEKTNLFIEEVCNIIGENVFSEKFTKEDLYNMCFSVVIFNIEHNSEIRIDKVKENNKYEYYSDEQNKSEYLSYYILKNSFNNNLCRRMIFPHIIKWYETGSYSKSSILESIADINNYEKRSHNFYLSVEEIQKNIYNTVDFIKNLKGDESLELINSEIISSYTWSELLSLNLDITKEEILELVKKNISNSINLKESLMKNEVIFLYDWDSMDNENAKEVIKLLNEELKHEYFVKLIEQITDSYLKSSFKSDCLVQFLGTISTVDNKRTKDYILNVLNDKNYFFPNPCGKISVEQWTWSNHINNIVRYIENNWSIKDFQNQFIKYVYSIDKVNQDKMALHRLNTLFR